MSEQFVDVGRDVTLCYETFGDPTDPPLVLIMGLGMQMTAWPDEFCEELAGRGFYVVRFDNRDVGRSTRFTAPPPTMRQMVTRRFPPGHYTLSDMANDTAGLLEALDLAPAHIVGLSMGGMIAQALTVEHPQLVRSMTSIMSNTGHRLKGQPTVKMFRTISKPAPFDRDGFVEHFATLFTIIGSPGYPPDREELRAEAGRAYDRGHNPEGGGRQIVAILSAKNRRKQLNGIRVPALVIHGKADKLVNPSGGKETARCIPGARLVLIDGMAHDLPRGLWERIEDEIAAHAHAADAARDPQPTSAA
jgi:pimeloyl-ACP methyl ester carboxylesterase